LPPGFRRAYCADLGDHLDDVAVRIDVTVSSLAV